jgi:hypothetical protein
VGEKKPHTSPSRVGHPRNKKGAPTVLRDALWLWVSRDEVAAAVLGVALFGGLHAEGLFLAEADRVHAVAGNAEADHVGANGIGTADAESEVVLGGAALVAMSFDVDANGGIRLEEIGGLGKILTSVGTNLGAVVIEVSVPHFLVEELVAGQGSLGGWRSGAGDSDADAGVGVAASAASGDGVSGAIAGRDGGGTLRGDGANFRRDRNVRRVGGGPRKLHGITSVDGGAIRGNRSGRLGGRWRRRVGRRWRKRGFLGAASDEQKQRASSNRDSAEVSAEHLSHTSPPGQ